MILSNYRGESVGPHFWRANSSTSYRPPGHLAVRLPTKHGSNHDLLLRHVLCHVLCYQLYRRHFGVYPGSTQCLTRFERRCRAQHGRHRGEAGARAAFKDLSERLARRLSFI